MPIQATRVQEPLRFNRIFLEKVWGGRALSRTPGIDLPGTQPIGETWEISDRREHNSVVQDGAHAGRTLRELMRDHGREILGRAHAARDGTFPLLVKLLDASEPLSVQVHPHPSTAIAGEETKTESWYILAAQPGACVYLGLRPGVDREALARVASTSAVVEMLVRHDVKPGQFVFVPGGSVHAIGAGVTLVEVQENADVTLRFYDWGRMGLDGKPRPVQVADAVRATRFGERLAGPFEPRARALENGNSRADLVDCDEFAVDLFELASAIECDTNDVALVYVAVSGRGRLKIGAQAWTIAPGDTWLVPASVGRHRIEASPQLRVLQARTKA
jgi:mannose-6-phosphate isomerase